MNERENIQQCFINLLEILEKQRPGYTAILGKGLTDESIKKCIKIHPIPESLIAIYSCVRGRCYERSNDFDFPTYLLPGYDLIDIDKVDKVIELLQQVHKDPDCWEWQPDMIPFLYGSGGDYYCVRTLSDDQSVVWVPKDDVLYIICQSIKDFILIVTECYKQNAYFLDEDRYLECNYDLEEKIIVDFNPNYYSQNDLEPEA
ncbi:MAG: SMI1/KNR4 family protein [Nostoc sp.]|uniref:SMI1/KNR4 family protein n=1 Tax=Nostoc sp. TaxID=1180 RepID=UPI002FF5F337